MISAQVQIERLEKLGCEAFALKDKYSGMPFEYAVYQGKTRHYLSTVADLKALADKLEKEKK